MSIYSTGQGLRLAARRSAGIGRVGLACSRQQCRAPKSAPSVRLFNGLSRHQEIATSAGNHHRFSARHGRPARTPPAVYVGIDVHRKRSQVAVINEGGEMLANRNVPNGTRPVLGVIGGLPPGTPVALEAAFGWGWLVELLEDYGFAPHLVHPSRCKAIASARLKNDKVDAAILAQLLRADLLPEAWIAPPAIRQLRALLRHRVALVRLRTRLRNRIHAIVADYGYDRPAGEYWSGPGRAWLAALELSAVSRELVEDDLGLIDALQERIDRL